jgi:hypothetical protein
MRKIIYHLTTFPCSFQIGKRRLNIMPFILPKTEHLNSKKGAIIRNKSGTKQENNSGYFV